MKLDRVRRHAALAVPEVEEADACDPDERSFRASGRVEIVKERLTNMSIHWSEAGHAGAGTTRLRHFRNHRDRGVARARENEVVIVVVFCKEEE